MLVSIQIPTYNQKQYIKQALDSALAQDYDNLQIIVSDDCSSDYDIFEFLKDYRNNSKVLIHRNKKNLGRVGNYRNTLYNLVKGEYFVNLDGDDYFICTGFISHAVKSIRTVGHKTAVFQAFSKIEKIKENKLNYIQIDENTYSIKGLDYINCLKNGVGFTHGSLVINTKSAKKVDYYNIDVLDSDYFSFLKILKEGDIVFWNQKVYKIRDHIQRATYTLNFEQVKKKYLALHDLKMSYLNNYDKNVSKKMLRVTSQNLFNQLLNCWLREKNKINRLGFMIRKFQPNKLSFLYLISFLSQRVKKTFQ